MGAWSTKIFDDDGATDIRGEYKILLGYQVAPDEAWKRIYDDYYSKYQDSDDEDVFWLSVALLQWQYGILRDEVKRKAIAVIEEESYLARWKESGNKIYEKRKKTLEEMKEKLLYEVNPVKKLPKCPAYYREKTKFQIGDIYAYQDKEGKCIYMQVVSESTSPVTDLCPELDFTSSSEFALIDIRTEKLAGLTDFSDITYRKMYITDEKEHYRAYMCDLINFDDEKKAKEQLIYIGNQELSKEVAMQKWYDSHCISSFDLENDFQKHCIESTYHIPCKITNEMLNDAFKVWLTDCRLENLEEKLSQEFMDWCKEAVEAIKKTLVRGIFLAVEDVRMSLILEREDWKSCSEYLCLTWLTKNNIDKFQIVIKEKMEGEQFDEWQEEIWRYHSRR